MTVSVSGTPVFGQARYRALPSASVVDIEPLFSTTNGLRFTEIMGVLASGVSVITTLTREGAPRGLTTTAVCSASAKPPLLLVCVDKASRTLPVLRDAQRFAVNFMRSGEHEICGVFASKRGDKFAGVRWSPGSSGVPILIDHAIAWAECRTTAEYEAGDHVILLGHVEHGEVPEGDAEPLVYYRRDWGMWHAHQAKPPD